MVRHRVTTIPVDLNIPLPSVAIELEANDHGLNRQRKDVARESSPTKKQSRFQGLASLEQPEPRLDTISDDVRLHSLCIGRREKNSETKITGHQRRYGERGDEVVSETEIQWMQVFVGSHDGELIFRIFCSVAFTRVATQ